MASVVPLICMPEQTRVGLPLRKLTELAEMLAATVGPAEAAWTFSRLSQQLRRAARSGSLHGVVFMHVAVSSDRLDAAADLLLEMSVALWALTDDEVAA